MCSASLKDSGKINCFTFFGLIGQPRNLSFDTHRNGEMKDRSLPWLGFNPDSSSVPFNHTLANSQSDPGAAIRPVVMKSLEYAKDFLLVLRVYANAVVPH